MGQIFAPTTYSIAYVGADYADEHNNLDPRRRRFIVRTADVSAFRGFSRYPSYFVHHHDRTQYASPEAMKTGTRPSAP
jgi:hypothetical protein